MGHKKSRSRHHSYDLALGCLDLFRSDIFGSSSAPPALGDQRRRSEFSNLRPRSNTDIRRRIKLHLFLCTLYCYDRWVLLYVTIPLYFQGVFPPFVGKWRSFCNETTSLARIWAQVLPLLFAPATDFPCKLPIKKFTFNFLPN